MKLGTRKELGHDDGLELILIFHAKGLAIGKPVDYILILLKIKQGEELLGKVLTTHVRFDIDHVDLLDAGRF